MRLSIIKSDGAVYVDGKAYSDIDLSFTPSNLHALQWYSTYGEIEWTDSPNETIDSLPDWAELSMSLWAVKDQEYQDSLKPPVLTDAEKLLAIRIERDKRLALSDWTQVADVQALYGEAWSLEWAAYRQALRELPNDPNLDLNNPNWPIPPQ